MSMGNNEHVYKQVSTKYMYKQTEIYTHINVTNIMLSINDIRIYVHL